MPQEPGVHKPEDYATLHGLPQPILPPAVFIQQLDKDGNPITPDPTEEPKQAPTQDGDEPAG